MSWSNVIIQKPRLQDTTFTCDLTTKDLYINDAFSTLRFKFALIILAIPFYTVGNIGYHVYSLIECDPVKSLTNMVRAVMYGISVAFAAIVGVAHPLEGRKLIAIIEDHWHEGTDKHLDFRVAPDGECKTCYLGYCFQPKGTLRDSGTTLLLKRAPAIR